MGLLFPVKKFKSTKFCPNPPLDFPEDLLGTFREPLGEPPGTAEPRLGIHGGREGNHGLDPPPVVLPSISFAFGWPRKNWVLKAFTGRVSKGWGRHFPFPGAAGRTACSQSCRAVGHWVSRGGSRAGSISQSLQRNLWVGFGKGLRVSTACMGTGFHGQHNPAPTQSYEAGTSACMETRLHGQQRQPVLLHF